MHKLFCLFLLINASVNIFAQQFSLPQNWFAGISPEINGYTRSEFGFGASLQFGLELNDQFSIGQKTGYYNDFNTLSAVEILIFFRYYLPWLHLPKSDDGPFVQAEAGAAIIMEHGYHVHDEVFPHFMGGIAAGWRFNLSQRFYAEPVIRLGYPQIWGIGLTFGIKFNGTGNSREQLAMSSEQLAVSSEQIEEESHRIDTNIHELKEISRELIEPAPIDTRWRVISFINDNGIEDHLLVVKDENDKLRIQTPSVVFRANHADFSGLSASLLDSNGSTLKRIALMLNSYNDYSVLIEGHANPTTPEGRRREAEEPALKRLSEERAQRVRDELIMHGVEQERLTIAGMSGSVMAVPYNDRNNWKNRRVEFILISGEIK